MATTFSGVSDSLAQFDRLVNAMTVLEIGTLIIFPLTLIAMRKRPLMRARLPYVIVVEVVWDIFSALMVNTTQTSTAWLQQDQSHYNCAFGNFIYTVILVAVWQIILARIVMFYRLAQANTWNHGSGEESRFDRMIYWIGYLVAPKDFLRADLRFKLLCKRNGVANRTSGTGKSANRAERAAAAAAAGKSRLGQVASMLRTSANASSSPALDITAEREMTTVTEVASAKFQTTSGMDWHGNTAAEADGADSNEDDDDAFNWRQARRLAEEILVWLLKIAFWSCMWGILCVIAMTFSDDRHAINLTTITGIEKYGDDFACGLTTWNAFMQSFYIVWNVFQLWLVVMCVLRIKKDSLGMANELLIVQACFSVLWTAVGIALMFKSPLSVLDGTSAGALGVVGLKLVVAWLHGVVAFGYPVGLTLWRDYTRRRLAKDLRFRTSKDVELVWATDVGSSTIQDICRNGFALEMPLFLSETDAEAGGRALTAAKFVALHERFVADEAPLELNLRASVKKAWREIVQGGAQDAPRMEATLRQSRALVFEMILTNYRDDLTRAFARPNAA